jgi:uncharacterized membrane protein YdjX (TVP38/TMEM64 family)
MIYGPLAGLLIASSGALLGAAAGYAAGALLGRGTLSRLAGSRLDRVSRQIARRGLLSMTIIRLLPVAPFTLVNFAAGASHISFRDFVFGTMLGMAPGVAAITLFSSQLSEALRAPSTFNLAMLLLSSLLIGAVVFWGWRRFGRRRAAAQRD